MKRESLKSKNKGVHKLNEPTLITATRNRERTMELIPLMERHRIKNQNKD